MKNRKPVSIVLIVAFVGLATSCTSLRRRSALELTPGRIGRILTTSGEKIEIGKLAHARFIGNSIQIGGQLRVPTAGTKIVKRDVGYAITPANGLTYEMDAFASSGQQFIFTTRSDIMIPLSEVEAVWDKEPNKTLTILAVVGGGAVGAFIVGAILWETNVIHTSFLW